MKGIRCTPAMGRGICQRLDDLELLDDGAGPSMRDNLMRPPSSTVWPLVTETVEWMRRCAMVGVRVCWSGLTTLEISCSISSRTTPLAWMRGRSAYGSDQGAHPDVLRQVRHPSRQASSASARYTHACGPECQRTCAGDPQGVTPHSIVAPAIAAAAQFLE